MKTLVESIFGSKESIADAADNSLWEGYDEAWSHGYLQAIWTPKNKNNILTAIYGPKAKMFRFQGNGPFTYRMSIEYISGDELFIDVQMNTNYWTSERLIKASNHIKGAFRSDPEMLLRDGKFESRAQARLIMHWKDFKKKYKPKK